MNISCEVEGRAGCVLLRALEPVAGVDRMALNRGLVAGAATDTKLRRQLTSGPSRLCQALGLTRATHNGCDLVDPASPLQVRDDGYTAGEVLVTPRIGINDAVDWPLRFALRRNECVPGQGVRGNRQRHQRRSRWWRAPLELQQEARLLLGRLDAGGLGKNTLYFRANWPVGASCRYIW